MFSVHMCGVFVLFYLHMTYSERRIENGKVTKKQKPYVVYLVKTDQSRQQYDAWLCGGSIVGPSSIITSAACVKDVEYMYAIAGYEKYVPAHKLEETECTKKLKKKIIMSCVPKSYELDYANVEKWSFVDIAVVKVESPYDFNDQAYLSYCSYQPSKIEISWEAKYREPGTDAGVYGWGHAKLWRSTDNHNDLNQDVLHYAAVRIQNKTDCKKYYEAYQEMPKIIDRYMICTHGPGNIDSDGDQITTYKPTAQGCEPGQVLRQGYCVDNAGFDLKRRAVEKLNNPTRRNGICQNDHGGPLVTWIGGREKLIGVSSVFRVTNTSECIGPDLFVSTQCNGAFLDCVISVYEEKPQRRICDESPLKRGFDIIQRDMSWIRHPDGPAQNELVLRPQQQVHRSH